MRPVFFDILARRPDYLALSAVTFASGVGTTLTGVAIFHELARIEVSSFFFTAAFALGILPGLFASQLAAVCLRRFDVARVMVAVQLLGAASVALPVLGLTFHVPWLLLASLPLTSATAGFLVPFTNIYVRANFRDEDLLAVAELSTLLLAVDFLVGSLAGSLLIETLGANLYFMLDAATYVAAAAVTFVLCRKYPTAFVGLKNAPAPVQAFRWQALSPANKRIFVLYPILAAACAPCTALLPSAGGAFGMGLGFGGLVVAPVLVLLLCKGMGQLLGPFLVRRLGLDKSLHDDRLIIGCLALFLGCYGVIFTVGSLPIAGAATIIAHVLSNIVFTLAFFGFKRAFCTAEIGTAAARQFQIAGAIMVGSSLVCGGLTTILPPTVAVAFGACGLIASWFLLRAARSQPQAQTVEGSLRS